MKKRKLSYKNSDFVHWHSHTEFSSFDGLAKVTDAVGTAREMGFPALAITDHGSLAGWIKFIKECKATKDKNGEELKTKPIKPILGEEFYVCRKQEYKNKEMQPDGRRGNRHLNLFATNWQGYQNLCKLSERAWVDGMYHGDPRVDLELISEFSDGLMCGSACLSSLINSNLLYGRYDAAKKTCALFKDIFKENFFLEVMYHGIPEEGRIIPDIIKLSSEMDIPIICSNDNHYTKKEHGKSHEVLMCMSTSRCITDPKHISFPYDEFYIKSANEMADIFGDLPQSISNSIAMLERIDSEDIEKNLFGGMRLPKYDIPNEFSSPAEYLEKLAWDGLKSLGWDKSEEHVTALKKELVDVKIAFDNNGYDFYTYFLIVWDYIKYAREKKIVVGCGRGSGFASVLLRCLKISYGPDPLKYKLLWERFLGFDTKKFIKENDFGFEVDKIAEIIEADENRDYEEDQGGVDRY